MKQSEEITRLSDALAGLASAITEIIDQRLNATSQPQQPQSTGTSAPAAEFLTKKQVAAMFRVSMRTLNNWMTKRWLPYFKLGRIVRFLRSDITEQMNRRHRMERLI